MVHSPFTLQAFKKRWRSTKEIPQLILSTLYGTVKVVNYLSINLCFTSFPEKVVDFPSFLLPKQSAVTNDFYLKSSPWSREAFYNGELKYKVKTANCTIITLPFYLHNTTSTDTSPSHITYFLRNLSGSCEYS